MRDLNIHVKHEYLPHGFEVAGRAVHHGAMNLVRYRKLRGLTQTDLAEIVGVTQPTVSRAERGDEGITLGTYRACAEALGVSLIDLLADERTAAEKLLLDAFRRLSPARQQGWVDLAQAVVLGDRTEPL